MENQERICTLCLKKCEHFESIDGNKTNVLDIFLPKMDLTGIQRPVMCKICAKVLKKCYDFKATCLYRHNCLAPLVNNKEAAQLDLKDVYLSKNVDVTCIPMDKDICVFCMSLVKNCCAVDVKSEDFMFEKMMEQCLPELDLSIIKKPVICEDCQKSLENCFRFVTKCLMVEGNINKYRESLDINSKEQIELTDLLHSKIRTLQTDDTDSTPIAIENQRCQEREQPEELEIGFEVDVIKQEQMSCNSENNNNIDNKNESFIALGIQSVEIEQPLTPTNIFALEEEDNQLGAIKIEKVVCEENNTDDEDEKCIIEVEDQKLFLNEEVEVKAEEHNGSKEADIGTQLETQSSKPNDPPRVTMYKCHSCPYWTKTKTMLDEHLLKHKVSPEVTTYQCDLCLYQTRTRQSLKRHVLMKHKDPSEVRMYKCDFCQFETKYKDYHKVHSLKHMEPSEIIMYKCDLCSFQTRYKYCLKTHLLTHKDPSEEKRFKCASCSFQTMWKNSLKDHVLKHMDPSEVKMFKCELCIFDTNHKYYYKKHIKMHCAPLEGPVYSCDLCMFRAKRKGSITIHMQKH